MPGEGERRCRNEVSLNEETAIHFVEIQKRHSDLMRGGLNVQGLEIPWQEVSLAQMYVEAYIN